jgi:hypothetical protein
MGRSKSMLQPEEGADEDNAAPALSVVEGPEAPLLQTERHETNDAGTAIRSDTINSPV